MGAVNLDCHRMHYTVSPRWPSMFAFLSLVFLYVFQYPIGRAFFDVQALENPIQDWLIAYAFVIYSSILLLVFMRMGIKGRKVVIEPPPAFFSETTSRLSLIAILAIVMFFFGWSYVMRELKIGMTIYTDFESLPFRIVGILFYGRLVLQPLILAYVANGYVDAGWVKRMIVFLMFFALGAWATLTSGSRFTAIMFSLPHLLLFRGKSRVLVFVVVAVVLVTVASLARNFYLPFFISDEYIEIYANAEYQENMLSDLSFLAIRYLVQRSMGIAEVLLTFDYGNIAPTFVDSLYSLVAFFLPVTLDLSVASTKNIYGLDDDAFGGFGLGLFPNYWVLLGGNLLTYSIGIAISAFLLGRGHRLLSIALVRLGFAEGVTLVFVILFIFFFEARSYIFPVVLCFGWLLSRPGTIKIVKAFVSSWKARVAPLKNLVGVWHR